MSGASAGAENLVLGGEEALPAGREGAASRRRGLLAALASAVLAAGAGAALGIVAHPGPDGDERLVADLSFTAAAAVQSAQRADARARAAERALADARQKLDALAAAGALQEYDDLQEAERLGLDKVIRSPALLADDRKRVLAAIVRESRRNGLDPLLVAAVIQVESHFDPFAVSHVGACGLMQLMPPTAKEISGEHLKPKHLFNPVLNIELGTAYIGRLFDRFGGDLRKALIAYNAGPGVARSVRHGSKAYRRLEAYPKAVLTAYRSLALAQQEAASPLAVR
jgi:soluble lytic murein transglycosylase